METLAFHSSPLLPDTYKLLTAALTNNRVMKVLYLYNDNNISDKDIPHFFQVITYNNTLQELDFTDCPNITKFGEHQLQNVLVKNNSLSVCVNFHKLC